MHDTALGDDVRIDDICDKLSLVVHDISKGATLAKREGLTCRRGIILLGRPSEEDGSVHDVVEDQIVKISAADRGRDMFVGNGIDECLVDRSEESNALARREGVNDGSRGEFGERGQVGCP